MAEENQIFWDIPISYEIDVDTEPATLLQESLKKPLKSSSGYTCQMHSCHSKSKVSCGIKYHKFPDTPKMLII